MTLPCVAVCFGKDSGHAFQAFVAKLCNFAAHGAQQMFVVRNVARGLEALEAFAKIALDYEAAAYEHFKCAIHRGRTCTGAQRRQFVLHFFGGDMFAGAQYDVGDGETLRGHWKIVLAEIFAKRFPSFGGVVFVFGHVTQRCAPEYQYEVRARVAVRCSARFLFLRPHDVVHRARPFRW